MAKRAIDTLKTCRECGELVYMGENNGRVLLWETGDYHDCY